MEKTPQQPEENDALWQLLGKCPPPQASPYFAARVVNHARSEPPNRWAWLALIWRPTLALAVVAVAALAVIPLGPPPDSRIADQDFEVIIELDNLIAMDQQTLWTDSSTYIQH